MHIRPIEPQELATFVALYTPAEYIPTVQTYVDRLLAHGTALLQHSSTIDIVTDTDISNFPMADAFIRAGYTEFTTRREYFIRNTPA